MENIAIRRAVPDDVPALVDLRAAFLAEVAGSDLAEPALREALTAYFASAVASGEFIAFLAIADGHAVASSGLVIHRNPPSAKNLQGLEAYVMNMYTTPAWRGRGIALAILRELVTVARQSKCRRIRIRTIARATPIYRRAGFVLVNDEMGIELRDDGQRKLEKETS